MAKVHAILFLAMLIALPTSAALLFQDQQPIAITPITDITKLPTDELSLPVTRGGGMFSPVYLPFEVKGDITHDANLRLTFPTFLAHKFDFVPDNYSSMHAVFIFRRDPSTQKVTMRDIAGMQKYAKVWQATHIIGGWVKVTDAGYSGGMTVMDATGKRLLTKEYPDPLPCFTLMGRMVQDWMAYRRQPVSDALKAELEYPMTRKIELLKLFGTAFQKPFRTDEEWAVYEEILRQDPNFGEVRWWMANQRIWELGRTTELDAEKARALLDHTVISALKEYSNQLMKTDPVLQNQADAALWKALNVQPDHSALLGRSMYDAAYWVRLAPGQWYDLGDLAAKYPSAHTILKRLADRFAERGWVDRTLALDLSTIQSGYLPGDGSFYDQYYRAGSTYHALGHPGAALFCFERALQDAGSREELLTAVAAFMAVLRDCAQHESVIALNKKMLEANIDDPHLFMYAFLSACDMADATQQTEWWPKVDKLPEPDRTICSMAYALANGKERPQVNIPIGNPWKLEDPSALNFSIYNYLFFAKKEEKRDTLIAQWRKAPRSPRVGAILEHFLLPEAANDVYGYAETMCWLAPEVPYWQALSAKAKMAGAQEMTVQELRIALDQMDKSIREPNAENIDGMLIQNAAAMTDPMDAAFPFKPEWAILTAIKLNDQALLDKAMMIYFRYLSLRTTSLNFVWKAHRRCFIVKVLNEMPADQADKYRKKFDRLSRSQ